MNNILDENKYTNKELFEMKNDGEIQALLADNSDKKSPLFRLAKSTFDFRTCFHEMCINMDIDAGNEEFVYFFDFDFYMYKQGGNITPDYTIILKNGLQDLKYDVCTTSFESDYNAIIDDLIILSERVANETDNANKDSFINIVSKPACGFKDALQRILFINQMLWQSGAMLVGLGRMDSFLIDYYHKDIEDKTITTEEAKIMLRHFLLTLHRHHWFKSSVLLGDTGQVIVLGGSNANGEYIRNELTDLFLDLITELKIADLKVVLRVNSRVPNELMEKAVDCMRTGNGSPLLANDDVIIPKLRAFGIPDEYVYDYATSACWEPLIAGKSSSQNNEATISCVNALNNVFLMERIDKITDFSMFFDAFIKHLRIECIKNERIIFERIKIKNTLMSIFISGCKESGKDLVDGGACLHDVGMTMAGLGNTVNSLIYINKYCFEKKEYSLGDFKKAILYNFSGYEELRSSLLAEPLHYGTDNLTTIELVNRIINKISETTSTYRGRNGEKLKFGLSSPSHILLGDYTDASCDGRLKGEPLIVHISNEKASSYTEIIEFASNLDYSENRFNGNVVDLMVNPSFVINNKEKFVKLLIMGIRVGFFQLQTNMVSSETLINAKNNPDDFTDLIVRVWGFSAYFVELPESYQNLIIERALRNEGKCA